MSRLQRLAAHAKDQDLSAQQVADILGVTKEVVYDLLHAKQIEALSFGGNGRRRAEHRRAKNYQRKTHHFEPRQVLAFIVKNTGGDRMTLFAEIELLLPQWLSFARLIAKQCDAAPTHSHQPLWGEHEDSFFLKSGSKPTKPDPFAGSPEMFPLETLVKPNANASTLP